MGLRRWTFSFVIAVVYSCAAGDQREGDPIPDESGKMSKMSFTTPDLSEEESHSQFLPDQLKCDGCRAVIHQVGEGGGLGFIGSEES